MGFIGRLLGKQENENFRAVVIDCHGVVDISDEYRRIALQEGWIELFGYRRDAFGVLVLEYIPVNG